MIIGIVGKAGAGKDTVADHLVANYGFVKQGFAAPLKEIVGRLFDLSHDQLHTQEGKEVVDERYGRSPRWLLQHIGTEVFRALYPNVWVDLLVREYTRICEHANSLNATVPPLVEPRWVISDVRFCNEAQAIEDVGGQVWRVVCPDNPKKLAADANTQHASEVEQKNIVPHVTLTARYGDLPRLYWLADEGVKALLGAAEFIDEETR